jgi:spermidine/putrescine-binding protein
VGAQNANFTFYATPNEAAKADVQDEILSDPAIYPSRDVQEKLEFIQDIGDALIVIIASLYRRVWNELECWSRNTRVFAAWPKITAIITMSHYQAGWETIQNT